MNFFLVSGLSGSGKSIALQALEDLGYYCIDNLPANLLSRFAEEVMKQGEDGTPDCAVSIDSRNRDFLRALPKNLDAIKQLGLNCKILFLEADEETLVRRFSETRRKHPLTDQRTASFGYKHSVPRDADFVFDARCLPNPYWEPELKALTGLDEEVRRFLAGSRHVEEMIEHIRGFMDYWLPAFQEENRSYITVAIGCTGGQHRSVYIADRLAAHFKHKPFNVQLRHRELPGALD